MIGIFWTLAESAQYRNCWDNVQRLGIFQPISLPRFLFRVGPKHFDGLVALPVPSLSFPPWHLLTSGLCEATFAATIPRPAAHLRLDPSRRMGVVSRWMVAFRSSCAGEVDGDSEWVSPATLQML